MGVLVSLYSASILLFQNVSEYHGLSNSTMGFSTLQLLVDKVICLTYDPQLIVCMSYEHLTFKRMRNAVGVIITK